MRKPKLSKAMKREAQREAAQEFFRRAHTPPTLYQPVEPAPEPRPSSAPTSIPSDLPRDGSVLSVADSKDLLRRLAEGELKQVRRR